MKLLLENWRKFLNEEEKRPIHIFFDMDGVLVDFAGEVAKAINENLNLASQGKSPHNPKTGSAKTLKKLIDAGVTQVTREQLEEINFKKDTKAERSKVEKLIGNYLMSLVSKDENIWLNMKKVEGADKMVEKAKQIAGPENVYILSSPVGQGTEDEPSPSVIAKRKWIQRYFPELSDRVILTSEKGKVKEVYDILRRKEIPILIDDRIKYVNQFRQSGGQTIHHNPAGAEGVARTLAAMAGAWAFKEPKTGPGQELESGFGLILKISPPANIDQLIQAGSQKYSGILPEGEQFTKIDKSHVTLISGKLYKDLLPAQKQNIEDNMVIPEAIVDDRNVFLATREMEGRKTLYLKIQNSPELNKALRSVLGEKWPEKYMHLSIANVHAGDSFKSVGDINETDEGEQKNIVPAVQPQQKKQKPDRPERVEIPNEIKPLGGILRDKMTPVAQVWPNLLKMKERPQVLMQILKGKGLSDEQIEAVLKILVS